MGWRICLWVLPGYCHAGRGEGDTFVENVVKGNFTKMRHCCSCYTSCHTQFALYSSVTVICKEIVPQFCCCQFAHARSGNTALCETNRQRCILWLGMGTMYYNRISCIYSVLFKLCENIVYWNILKASCFLSAACLLSRYNS